MGYEVCDCAGCGGEVAIVDACLLPLVKCGVGTAPHPDAKRYCSQQCYEFHTSHKSKAAPMPTMTDEQMITLLVAHAEDPWFNYTDAAKVWKQAAARLRELAADNAKMRGKATAFDLLHTCAACGCCLSEQHGTPYCQDTCYPTQEQQEEWSDKYRTTLGEKA